VQREQALELLDVLASTELLMHWLQQDKRVGVLPGR